MSSKRSDDNRGFSLLPGFKLGDLSEHLLLPGDPDRVSLMASQWDSAVEYDLPRRYRAAVGTHKGVRIGALSHGIGAPSLECALTEAADLGVKTFIRVGTTGSLHTHISCGDLVVNDASVRLDGTTHAYVPAEYPAAASHEVTTALIEACRGMGVRYHVGLGCTTSSFYVGQGRPGFDGYRTARSEQVVDELARSQVLNLDMETAALLTLARIYGLRAGSKTSRGWTKFAFSVPIEIVSL